MELPHTKPAGAGLSLAKGRTLLSSKWLSVMFVIVFLTGMMAGSLKQQLQQGDSAPAMPVTAADQQPFQRAVLANQQQQQPAATSNRTIFSADLSALSRLNALIQQGALDAKACQPKSFGKGWGGHHLCTHHVPAKPCHFYSFGVQSDYSFDVAVADTWGCSGFAADPTVVHNSTLHPGVTFHNVAANSPKAASGKRSNWVQTSIPSLRQWLKHDRIAVLKMDCEGCEYSLAADILAEDPSFLSRVDQFATEVHWSRMWMKSTTEMYALASLFELLEEAGLKLMHVNLTPCGAFAARTGILPELQLYMGVLFADGPQQQCHNYLFARV